MDLALLRMLTLELWKKDPYIVPEASPLIIMDSKSAVCMDNNGMDTKVTRHIYRRFYFVINGKIVKCKILNCMKDVFSWHTLQLEML